MNSFKRVLSLVLVAVSLCVCIALCFGCENKALLGTYRYKGASDFVFLELKTKGNAEFYYLQMQQDGTPESKEILYEGHNLFYATFTVDGENITLEYSSDSSGRAVKESSTGKIHSNGNIVLDMLFGVTNIVLKKQ